MPHFGNEDQEELWNDIRSKVRESSDPKEMILMIVDAVKDGILSGLFERKSD